ncbi:HD domain-containing phosphohydrolase [Candidatus Villigracilis proximus]|uniref:HD-GYP domain-containing protein n=1 Tax=Candidatus Villigracilis proximus TaxID=3140683 RepID=UPI0031EA0080
MPQSLDAQSIQKQFGEMNKMLMRVMAHLARTNDGQTSLVLRDLTQISSSLNSIKQGTTNYFDTHQRQVRVLVGVGSAINSSLKLKQVLEEVMDTLIALMGAERGFLMLREFDGEMKVRIARGIDHVDLNEDAFAISKTIVGRVVKTGEAVLTTNAQDDPRFIEQLSVAAYRLLSILCVPLKLKDELIGVIYVDNRVHTGIFQDDDLSLISAFANQAAVAIDNARLFDDLQASNAELEIAYSATLEGWVRALDLRDKETEGHTKRVTVLTERLARSMGVDDEAMVHITRGALLHDIGKMAIPDGILLKPSGLTEEERELVQQHPIYAFEMLKPIKFLHPALDIPYCHHEKWDGSGYPRGLKGEEIPFAARIFSVVDVWDALVSDRPYRKGILPAEVKKSIYELSGSHFDPKIVDAFLSLDDLSTILRKLKSD